MADIYVAPKRIGNSWGIIIPKKTADNLGINENIELHVNVERAANIKDLVGTFKTRVTLEELKKERREGWKE